MYIFRICRYVAHLLSRVSHSLPKWLAGGPHYRHTLQTHSFSFLTQRTYSCSNFVAISSLVLELLKNAVFSSEWDILYNKNTQLYYKRQCCFITDQSSLSSLQLITPCTKCVKFSLCLNKGTSTLR